MTPDEHAIRNWRRFVIVSASLRTRRYGIKSSDKDTGCFLAPVGNHAVYGSANTYSAL